MDKKKVKKINKSKKQTLKRIVKNTDKKGVFLKRFKKEAKKIADSSFDTSKKVLRKTQKAARALKNQAQDKVIKKRNWKKIFKTSLIFGGYAILVTIIIIILENGYDMRDVKSMKREIGRRSEEKIANTIKKDKPEYITRISEKEIFDFEKVDLEKLDFQKKVPILMYHYIEPVNPSESRLRKGLTVSPEKFDEQMRYLSENGFTTLTMTEYFGKIAQNLELPPKPVLITVDDGYRNFYLNAAPVLNKYGQKATTFLISNSIGYPAYMNWDMVRELYKQGYEFGSHSISHPNLKSLIDSKLEEELQDSKWQIEQEIGGPVNFFCYPSGFYNQNVIEFTRVAGYKGAVTTGSGVDLSNKNVFEMYRYRISDDMNISQFAWTVGQAYQ